jgi:hypothetical protein
MRNATVAITEDLHIAVFGYRLLDNNVDMKTVVFVHLPGGERKLSILIKGAHAPLKDKEKAKPRR